MNIHRDKNHIIELCNKILKLNKGTLDLFSSLEPLLEKYFFTQDLINFCMAMNDEDWISPQNCRQYCSDEFIKQMDDAEKKLLDFYKDDIEIFVKDVLTELEQMDKQDMNR